MKAPQLLIITALLLFILAVDQERRYLREDDAYIARLTELRRQASDVEGFSGGREIRALQEGINTTDLGVATNIAVMPDHVAVLGTHGSRRWYP